MGSDEESVALIVPVERAQKIRCELEKLKLWDATYKLKKLEDSGKVAVPIYATNENISAIVNKWPDFPIARLHLPISKKTKVQQNSPTAILQSEIKCLLKQYGLAEKLLDEVPSKWERHGDLVIVPADAFSSQQWNLIGSNLWQIVTKCLACRRLARHSPVTNDGFRSSKVVMLLGDDGEVTHMDNGIKYSYDVTKCMFSAGNITEKMRIANLDCTSETVVDLYAGIGYFTLPYLIHARALHVHACEWNPHALLALRNNLLINRVSERCTVHGGDNRLLQLPPVADRVNLGLIPSSEEGWPVAVQVLKSCGGILHIHGNVTTIPQRSLAVEPDDEDVYQQRDGQNISVTDVHQQRDRQNISVTDVHQQRDRQNISVTDKISGHFCPLHQNQEIQNVSLFDKSNGHLPSFCHDGEKKTLIKESDTESGVLGTSDSVCKDCRNVRTSNKDMSDSKPSCDHVVVTDSISAGAHDIVVQNGISVMPEKKPSSVLDAVGSHPSGQSQTLSDLVNDMSQHHENCPHKKVESANMKAVPLHNDGKAAHTASCGYNLTSLSNVAENFNRQEVSHLCLKSSGKGQVILACDKWSLYVQRRIKSLLEARKGGVWMVKLLHVEVVKSYAPHIVHAVLDLECRPVGE